LGLVVCLAGRIDLLAEDKHGHYWIVDWKTAARLSRGDASGQDRDEFLELDDQIGSYVMALRRKLGIDVRGFVYVELKKAYPTDPQRNLQARLGRMYSVNKNQSVDYDTYRNTVMEHDAEAFEAGLYDEFLTYLKESGERFHGRYQIAKLDEELIEIERNLFYEASEMCNANTHIYPSAGRFNCSQCAFRQPCIEKNRQGDFQYMLDTLFTKREKHYWVKDISTDTQGGE
jgi:CRISPR/Cas system-associated exonuclease Cas4 (RecB family)